MSSPPRNPKYICLNLFKSQLCQNLQNYPSYSLSFTFNNTSPIETEQIKLPKITFTDKKYFLDVSKLKETGNQIVIQAVTKTIFLIKRTLSKITIPFSLSKCNKDKQWFFLKDEKDQIVLKLLLSLKTNIPLEKNEKSKSEIILPHGLLYNKSTKFDSKMLIKTNDILKETFLYNNKSMMNLNSYTMVNRRNNAPSLTQIFNRNTNLLSIIEKDSVCYSSDQTIINEEENNEKVNIKDIKREISNKADCLLQEQKDIDKEKKEILQREISLNKAEEYINKKANELNEKIISFEKEKMAFNSKRAEINNKCGKLKKIQQRAQVANELDLYNKEIYKDLNFVYYNSCSNTAQTIHNLNILSRQTINSIITLEDEYEQKKDIIEDKQLSIKSNLKKFKAEYLKSKHLNSTNFNSHCSELNLLPAENSKFPIMTKNFYTVNKNIEEKNHQNKLKTKTTKVIESLRPKVLQQTEEERSKSKRKLKSVNDIKIAPVKPQKTVVMAVKGKYKSITQKKI